MKYRSGFRIILSLILIMSLSAVYVRPAAAASSFDVVLLTPSSAELKIGEELQLKAVSVGLNHITFKSSSSKIASVGVTGLVTAKSRGTVTITAKTRLAEAQCKIRVVPTKISLNQTAVRLENGQSFQLKATVSSGSEPSFRSTRPSIAMVDDDGLITALKPGTSKIKVTADKTSVYCSVKVVYPTIRLNKTSVSLYRNQTFQLTAAVSSGLEPVFKSSSGSVASVDHQGLITALKHGSSRITVTCDGAVSVCTVTVKKPKIRLSASSIHLKPGESAQLTAWVSSGNPPLYKSGSPSVFSVSQKGHIKALKAGSGYVTVSEDGASRKCKVTVIKLKQKSSSKKSSSKSSGKSRKSGHSRR